MRVSVTGKRPATCAYRVDLLMELWEALDNASGITGKTKRRITEEALRMWLDANCDDEKTDEIA